MRKPVVIVHIVKELRDERSYRRGLDTIAQAISEILHREENVVGTSL